MSFLTIPLILQITTEYPTIMNFRSNGEYVGSSADLVAYLTPPSYNTFYGDYASKVESRIKGYLSEKIIFLGWMNCILAIICFIRFDKKKHGLSKIAFRFKPPEDAGFWIISGIFFFIISLGPTLQFLGEKINLGGLSLLYSLQSQTPFLWLARAYERYSIGLFLSITVLAGYSIKNLSRNKKNINTMICFILLNTKSKNSCSGFLYPTKAEEKTKSNISLNPILSIIYEVLYFS